MLIIWYAPRIPPKLHHFAIKKIDNVLLDAEEYKTEYSPPGFRLATRGGTGNTQIPPRIDERVVWKQRKQ